MPLRMARTISRVLLPRFVQEIADRVCSNPASHKECGPFLMLPEQRRRPFMMLARDIEFDINEHLFLHGLDSLLHCRHFPLEVGRDLIDRKGSVSWPLRLEGKLFQLNWFNGRRRNLKNFSK